MPDTEDLWTLALDWQAYLEEATAQVDSNSVARAVREELRAHLETERPSAIAEGADPETAARRAVVAMGEARSVAGAVGVRHGSVLWRRAWWMGAAAGGLVAALANGMGAVALLAPGVLGSLTPWQGPWVSVLTLAFLIAPLAVVALWAGRGAGPEPVEGAAGAASIFGFVLAFYVLDLVQNAIVHRLLPSGLPVVASPMVRLHPAAGMMLSGPLTAVPTYVLGALLVSAAAYGLRRAAEALPVRARR